jgi:hypothetical protein
MRQTHLLDRFAHSEQWVERNSRILEHHPYSSPADAAKLSARQAEKLRRAQPSAASDPRSLRQQANQRADRHRLSGSTFTDDTVGLTRRDLEGDAPDDMTAVAPYPNIEV